MTLDLTKYGATTAPAQGGAGGNLDLSKYGAVPAPTTTGSDTTPTEPNYFQRVGAAYTKAGTGLISDLQQTFSSDSPFAAQRAALRTVGTVARAAFTPITELPIVKKATDALTTGVQSIPAAHDLIQRAYDTAQKYPELAKDLGNIVDIASLGLGSTVEQPVSRAASAVAKDISKSVPLTSSENAVQSKIVDLFTKSIKPTAKKTMPQAERYNADILTALRTIRDNAPNLNIEDATGELVSGATPKTINELGQALDQTKTSVFAQYDALAKKAGGAGATIDPTPIAKELDAVTANKALQLTSPSVIDYAKQWADRLKAMGPLDPQTTQEVIKIMNSNLQAFYKNPTYDAASRVAVDAGIANNFRKALDSAIEGATGDQYQALKSQYAALKAIENDVVRASIRDARKNAKGLLDYTDIFTSGQMISGILSLNPAMFTKGAIERGFKEYIKYLNDPNRAIKNIFDALGKSSAANASNL